METRQISQYSQFERLKHNNIEVIKDQNPNNLHHKVFIIDRETVITGSFNPSANGDKHNDENLVIIHDKEIAERFAMELASMGICIISGLARGIDTIVHKTALKNKGRTIAVLGSGLNVYYPPENKFLYEKISKTGAVISEFPLDTKPLKHNFLQRNRLISGLSLAVVIIEGRRRSGTISTATWAADQGRDVFAVPGPVDSPLSEAPNFLLSQGAIFATTPHDILEYLDE